jgi:hypothetical protein
MSDWNQFEDFDVRESVIKTKHLNFEKESINESRGPTGLFGERKA